MLEANHVAQNVPIQKLDGRRARGDRSRLAVLDRALGIASVEGLEGLTLGRLAAEAGISKGNLTVLFGDKEALQLATIDASIARMVSIVVEPALRKTSPFARVQALCDGWFKRIAGGDFPGGCFMYATAHEYRARSGALHDRAVHNLLLWRKTLGKQLREAQAAGELRPDIDVVDAVITLVAYQNTAHLAQTTGDTAMFEHAWRLSRRFLDSLLIHHAPKPKRVRQK